jgi:hypothetical protein
MWWVFHATAGFLGRVDSQTQCGFWAEEPADHGFDPGRLITVDLARTPTATTAKQIGFREVEVDDCFTGPDGVVSGTTLGPAWPGQRPDLRVHHGGVLAGQRRPAGRDPLRRALRTDPGGAGHAGPGGRPSPGRSGQPTASPVTMWIDLASPEHCDAGIDSPTRTAPRWSGTNIMTSHTPAPGPDIPDGTPGPSRAPAVGPPTSPDPGRVRPRRRRRRHRPQDPRRRR